MKKLQKLLSLKYIEDISANLITDFTIQYLTEKRREKMRAPKEKGLVALLSLTLLLMLFLAMIPTASASTIILYPIADSWVGSDYPTVNHGGNYTLHCRSDTSLLLGDVIKRTYLKFNLTGIDPDTIGSATLYLYSTEATIPPDYMDVDAHKTGDDWIEGPAVGDIDWDSAPAVGDYLTTKAVDGVDKWYGWDGDAMTSYLKAEAAGDGIVSFVLKLPDDDPPTHDPMWHRDFSSKEGTHSPYLEITELPPPVGGHMVPILMAEKSSLPAISIDLVSALLVAIALTTILIRCERKRATKTRL